MSLSAVEVERILSNGERITTNSDEQKDDATKNSHNSHNSQPSELTKPDLNPLALYGLAGEIVRAVDPITESDMVATLTNLLAGFGNIVGPIPYVSVGDARHYLNIYVVQVGDTAKGRKGTAWATPAAMLRNIDSDWADNRVTGGLSSGEGVIYAVRDARYQSKPIREDGRIVAYEDVLVDKGEEDKRLFLLEEEFSQALKVMSREGNILSQIIRRAWDHKALVCLTKNNPNKATGAHISIVGHITRNELLRHLVENEQTNGFANRFCWFMDSRSKDLDNPPKTDTGEFIPLIDRLRSAVDFSRRVGEMRRDATAAAEGHLSRAIRHQAWTGRSHDCSR